MDIKTPDIIRNRAKDFFGTDSIDICYPPKIFYMKEEHEFRTYKVIVSDKDKTQSYTILTCPKENIYSGFTKTGFT